MRRRLPLAIVVSLLTLPLGALTVSFAPLRLEVASVDLPALPEAHPPSTMSVSALPTGSLAGRAAFAYRGGSFLEARDFSQVALLVRHPRGDVLIDTGLGTHAVEQFSRAPWIMRQLSMLTPTTTAAQQLLAGGYPLERLTGIVPTHVHWDHISGVPDFPGVPVWLGAVEQAFIEEGGEMSAVMRDFTDVEIHPYAFSSDPYLGFEESFDVFGDGAMVIVPAPGHTPGSVVIFLCLPSGQRLGLLGDLVWQTEGITLPAERPWISRRRVDHDPDAVREVISHIAGLRARFPEITWLPAHDARAMANVPVFPATLQ